MTYKILIYRNNKFYREENLKKKNNGIYVYKWANVESGSYFFEIKNEKGEMKGVTYSHTAPFATDFEAVAEKNVHPKSITGFQKGIDILISYNDLTDTFILSKMKFYKMTLNIADFGIEKAEKIKISGSFNNWTPEEAPIARKSNEIYEVVLAIPEGVYEYKYLIDEKWYPEKDNLKLIIGENGELFPKGDLGTGKFVFEAINKNTDLKAIVHNHRSLQYFNKLSDREYEFTVRTQIDDVERAYISIVLHEEDNYEMLYELERFSDKTNKFDYFERIIDFGKDVDRISYYFILEDGGIKAYFDGKNLTYKKPGRLQVKTDDNNIQIFNIPTWSKEAIWYNVFPDRFYNGDSYNDPVFNEFGPEAFLENEMHEQNFIEKFKWSKNNKL